MVDVHPEILLKTVEELAMFDNTSFKRLLRSPLKQSDLRPLEPECKWIELWEPLSDEDFKRAAKFMEGYPDVLLRATGTFGFQNLDFLKWFPEIQRLQLDLTGLDDIDGFEHLSGYLESLSFCGTRRHHSLRFLEKFPRLRDLGLEGHSKDFESIGALSNLRTLGLRSVTLPDLSALLSLRELERLTIYLGGTKNLSQIPEIGKLRYLELFRIKGLQDLGALSQTLSLEFINLQQLSAVTWLPSFATLTKLRRVQISTMKRLIDLSPVADAPNLEDLHVAGMKHLPVETVDPFISHVALKNASFHLGSNRKDNAATALLGLPKATHLTPNLFQWGP